MSDAGFGGVPLTDEPDWIEAADRDYNTFCRHQRAEVDGDKRTLTCKKCGASLDPITFLVDRAGQLARRHVEAEEIARIRAELTVHAVGQDGVPTRCRMNVGSKYVFTVTNRASRVTCQRCRSRLDSQGLLYSYLDGHEVLL